jgi:hypothetical protein
MWPAIGLLLAGHFQAKESLISLFPFVGIVPESSAVANDI